MTRINAGYHPARLCDQHLIAEYRELPRMVRFVHQARRPLPQIPFTLGAGHMYSCARFGAYLAERHRQIITVMLARGFSPTMSAAQIEDFPEDAREYPSQQWLTAAQILVSERITTRLRGMRRIPTWERKARHVA